MRAVESLEDFTLMGPFCPNHIKFQTPNSDSKLEEKLTLSSKEDMRTLVNYNPSSCKSENVNCDVLLLSKIYHV